MDGDADGFRDGLKACFADLRDPRIAKSCDHLLIDILSMAVLAVACGADEWTGMETFARLRYDWLKTFLQLPGGVPSHDTFRRVFGLLDRKQFATCLFRWTQAIHEATGGKLIAMDGKTLRRSFCEEDRVEGVALGHRLGQRERLDAGANRLRGKIERDHGDPGTAEVVKPQRLHGDDRRHGLPDGGLLEQIREQRGHYVVALKKRTNPACAATCGSSTRMASTGTSPV